MSDLECRAWTLLLTGDESGIVGGAGRHFEKHPQHYERVTVVERDPVIRHIAELEAENARLREAARNWVDAHYKACATMRCAPDEEAAAVAALLGAGDE